MRTYLVTVKLKKNPDHDPHNKVTGKCPVRPNKLCTDVTGEHHTVMNSVSEDVTAEQVAASWREKGLHVTRVEEVGTYLSVE